MSRFFKLFLWIAIALATTSCLTIEELYTFNKDGSGQMELAFDLKQLAMFVEEGPQRDSLFMMSAMFDEMTPQLEEIDGITRVETFEDRENMRIGMRYQFSDMAALNSALNNVLILEGQDGHAFFTQDKDVLTRHAVPANQGISLVDAVAQSFMSEGADPEEAKMVLGIMKYQTRYAFPDRLKVVYAKAETEVSEEEREQVTLMATFEELISDRDQLDASFVLK
jgi:hypothetical protein